MDFAADFGNLFGLLRLSAGTNVAFTYSSTPADELASLLEGLRAEHADVQIEAFQLEASSSASYKALLPAIEECKTLSGSLDISASLF